MTKEKLFENEIFDDRAYFKTKQHYVEMAEKLPALLASLSAEGLPTDYDFYLEITANEGTFKEWIDAQYMRRMEGMGFVPTEERKRIAGIYSDLYSLLSDDVSELRRMRREKLPVVAEGDSIAVDMDKIEEMANKAATTKVNGTKIQQYWDEVQDVLKAMDQLREFEKSNGLPDFVNGELSFLLDGRPQRYTMDSFIKQGGGVELFQQIAAPYFTKK